jgi:hypothetical protein
MCEQDTAAVGIRAAKNAECGRCRAALPPNGLTHEFPAAA